MVHCAGLADTSTKEAPDGLRCAGSPQLWGGFGETNGEEGDHHHESIMNVMGSSAHDTRFL